MIRAITPTSPKPVLSRAKTLIGPLIIGLALGACSTDSFRDAVGISKNSPDETQVTTNQPLAVPPDYTLRPPSNGVQAPRQTAQQPLDNSRPQPIQPFEKRNPPVETATRQVPPQPNSVPPVAAQPPPVVTASAQAPRTTGAPTTLGQPAAQTAPAKPRPTDKDYAKTVENARQEKIAQEKARNPNYGTWRNIWGVLWN